MKIKNYEQIKVHDLKIIVREKELDKNYDLEEDLENSDYEYIDDKEYSDLNLKNDNIPDNAYLPAEDCSHDPNIPEDTSLPWWKKTPHQFVNSVWYCRYHKNPIKIIIMIDKEIEWQQKITKNNENNEK